MRGIKSFVAFFALAVSMAGWAPSAFAGCTGSSPTWSSTPDQSSLSTCISNASAGDTINVSAGGATWSGSVVINKSVYVIGAGQGFTVISNNSFFVTGVSSTGNPSVPSVRISGFTFNCNGTADCITFENSQGVRFDHSAMTEPTATTCVLSYALGAAPNQILVDHVAFTYCQEETLGNDYANTGNGTNYRWSAPNPVGTVNAVYYEDDSFTYPDGSSGGYFNCFDSLQGGSYVVRFSTLSGCRFESHGIQADNQRGTRSYEMYNDTLTNPAAPSYWPWSQRSGTGMVFHNTSDGTFLNNIFRIDGPRLNEDSIASQVPGWQFCDGTTRSSYLSAPGNLGSLVPFGSSKTVIVDAQGPSGYRCRDQIGAGSDTSTWAAGWSTTPPPQGLTPLYVWRNTQPGGEIPVVLTCESDGDVLCGFQASNVQQNRDYYLFNPSFNGTSGIGEGPIASRPSSCTTGVAYWATDQGSWNQKLSPNTSGELYVCTSANTWSVYYTPYTYPHPLQGSGGGTQPAPPTNLKATVQ